MREHLFRTSAFLRREKNGVDAALWERGTALLAARLAEQRASGVLEEMPALTQQPWMNHKPPTIHKRTDLPHYLANCSLCSMCNNATQH